MARKTARDDDISTRPKIRERLKKVFDAIDNGFEDARERHDKILDAWDAYNCVLGAKQFYNGTSQLYIPIIRVAVNARRTRFVNQMFPQNGRYVDVTTPDEKSAPLETVALIEHNIRNARLRTQVMPALCVNGDIEGQYNVYIDWNEIERHVATRERNPVKVGGVDVPEAGEVEEIKEETITESCTGMEVLHDTDVMVLPATSNTIDEALMNGGSATIVRRWTKEKIQKLIDDGDVEKEAGEALLDAMSKVKDDLKDTQKNLLKVVGIKVDQGSKVAVAYETWTRLKVDGKMRICRAYLGGDHGGGKLVLGCKLNPYWCDRVPLLSAPVEKQAGVFKGRSLIQAGVMDLQVYANDAINMSADGLPFHSVPITVVDPEKVQRWESLVADVGAVWPVGQDGAKVLQYPDVTPSALQVVQACKAQIFESMGVNPSMLPQQTGRPGGKRNQAEVALEQQVDLLTTADAVTNIENEILTPYVQRALDYDNQFRQDDVLVKMFGPRGQRAIMQRVPPAQRHNRYVLSWLGVEAARDAARIQQMIAGFAVLQKVPPQMYQGFRLNAIPLIQRFVETTYGASLGPQIFENVSELYTVDPMEENAMLAQRFPVPVQPLDDDPKHLAAHMQLLAGLQPGSIEERLTREHISAHQAQMQAKTMAAAMQRQAGGPGGAPGAGRGTQPGAQPGGARPHRGPPGMINQDRMPAAGAIAAPRKAG